MWNSLRNISTNLLNSSTCFTSTKRTTFILRRTRPIKLNKLVTDQPKKLKKLSYYYEVVENTDFKKKPPVEIVLTQDVSGIGMKGEKLELNVYIAYRDLLLPKLAVYANSPEAKALEKVSDEKQYTSIYSKIVENYLASQAVSIILSNDTEWTLEPWHIKLALRKNGILTNDHCITIPKKISGPNLEIENKDFIVYLTMNKTEKFPLRCRIYHWSTTEPTFNQRSFDVNAPSQPLFLDEKEMIDKLRKIEEEIRKSEKLKKYGGNK